MGLWLPPEILVRIVSYVSDVSVLLSLRLVSRDWTMAADTELERWGCLSLDPDTMDKFDTKHRKMALRKRITDVAIIVPDRDYWHTYDIDGLLKIEDPVSFAAYERLRKTLVTKIHRLPYLARLSFHIRPPRREIAPMSSGPMIENNHFLAGIMATLAEALKKSGYRRVINRRLKELSIQCLPAKIGYASAANRNWNEVAYLVEKTIRKLDLKSLKLGLIAPTVWQSGGNASFATWGTTNRFDAPAMWLTGATHSLRHLSITCWGFYIKNITGSPHSRFFPYLESLELRGCAFTSDRQANWLLQHRTLRSVILDDCAIVYKLRLKDRNPQKECCTSVDMIIEKGGAMQEYRATWADFFKRLHVWTELRHFKFGSSRVRQPGEDGPIFESESAIGPNLRQASAKFLFGLFPDRYLHLDDGSERCEWILRPASGPAKRPYWVTNSQHSDKNALVTLLRRIKQDVKWSDTSDHAGYVSNLIGKVKRKDKSESSTGKGSKGSSCKKSKSSPK